MTMFVKISSLVVCLVFIQSTLNAAASEDSSRRRHPRAPLNTNNKYLHILDPDHPEGDVYEGSTVDKDCHYSHADDKVDQSWWTRNEKIITTGNNSGHLILKNITSKDSGTYICNAKLKGGLTVSKKIEIRVTVPTITPVKVEHIVKIGENVSLSCLVNKTSFEDSAWRKLDGLKNVRRIDNVKSNKDYDDTHYILDLHLVRVSRDDNGTYICEATIDGKKIATRTHLRVLEKPEISEFNVRPIGAGNVRLNWTLFDGNSPVTKYDVFFKVDGNEHYVPLETVKVSNCKDCSYDLESEKLENHKSYKFSIATRNSEGNSPIAESNVVNMSVIDPVDTIPTEFNTTATDRSITINWSVERMRPNSSYHYRINVTDSRKPEKVKSYNSTNKATRHVIDNLEPRTTYTIEVQGCLDDEGHKENDCTPWTERNVTTQSGSGSSSVLHSTGGFGLITLATIVSMFFLRV